MTDGETTILFCFEGQLTIAGEAVIDGDLAVLTGDGGVTIQGEGRGLLLSSPPLNESIARHGPLLSTQGELKKRLLTTNWVS